MRMYLVNTKGAARPYLGVGQVPSDSCIVLADTERDAQLEGQLKWARFHRSIPPPLPARAMPAPEIPTHVVIPVQQSKELSIAASKLSDFLGGILDSSASKAHDVRVNKEKMAEAFALADWIATALSEDK